MQKKFFEKCKEKLIKVLDKLIKWVYNIIKLIEEYVNTHYMDIRYQQTGGD